LSLAGAGRCCRTRVVGYVYETVGGFDESAMERLLERAVAADVVTEFDTGGGLLFWFNGPPGAALRSVRRTALLIAGPRTTPVRS
jgi:hypothetical protein